MKVSPAEASERLRDLLPRGSTVYIKKLYSKRDQNGNSRTLLSYLCIKTVNEYKGPELCCLDVLVASLMGLRLPHSEHYGSGVWVWGSGEEEIKAVAGYLHRDYGTVYIEHW